MNHPSTNHLIDIATRHGLTILWHRGGPKGAWLPPSMISIRHGMDDAETISTLAHEMAHAHHGDPCGHNPTTEHRAWKRAAHWLVCPNRYRAAELTYGPDPRRIAAELGVTTHIIRTWRDTHERTTP